MEGLPARFIFVEDQDPTEIVLDSLKKLTREIQEGQDSHGFIFGRLTTILGGTRYEKFISRVNNCKSRETLTQFVYNIYLAIAGLNGPKRGIKVKVRGQLAFEKDLGIRLKH